jgi:hypothetical protein
VGDAQQNPSFVARLSSLVMVRGAAVGYRGGSVQWWDRRWLWLLTRSAAERTSIGSVMSRGGVGGCECPSRRDARQGESCFLHVQTLLVAAEASRVPGGRKSGTQFMTSIVIAAGIAIIGFVLVASSMRIVQG